jgi:hypothetical protein
VVDRLLAAVVVVLVAGALVEALRPHHSPTRPVVRAPMTPVLRCRSVDRRLLLTGRRTSDYLILPCGR